MLDPEKQGAVAKVRFLSIGNEKFDRIIQFRHSINQLECLINHSYSRKQLLERGY